jgi:hypothetical protein
LTLESHLTQAHLDALLILAGNNNEKNERWGGRENNGGGENILFERVAPEPLKNNGFINIKTIFA